MISVLVPQSSHLLHYVYENFLFSLNNEEKESLGMNSISNVGKLKSYSSAIILLSLNLSQQGN